MPFPNNYNRGSVERALQVHFPDQSIDWMRNANGGYTVSVGIGLIRTRTLRETYMLVVGLAEGKRLKEKELRQEVETTSTFGSPTPMNWIA